MSKTTLTRRAFVGASSAAAGGLVFGFHVPLASAAGAAVAAGAATAALSPEVNAWVVVRPNDQVVIRIVRSEMGQGTLTGLAQLVAEELDCDWSQVTTEYPTPGQNLARDRVWGSFATTGSRGIRDSNEYVRKGGAAARAMLVQAAADRWGVPASECTAAVGIVTHAPSGRKTSYGKVAAAAAKLAPPADVKLKDPKDWRIAGQPLKRLDTAPKLDGSMIYGVDLKMPGMLVANIKDCPTSGGKIRKFDASVALSKPGVRKVVAVGDSAVAVVADTFWHAKSALEAMPIEWDHGPHAKLSSADIAATLRAGFDAKQAFEGNKAGDAPTALAASHRVIEAVYAFPYQAHATMEPMNATAVWTAERCDVWCPTQNPEAAHAMVVQTSGLAAAQCDVHKLPLGGGFGRRGASDYVRQAVLIAKELPGTPIKLMWTREEDMQHDWYHPITQCRLRAGLDAEGNVTALHMRISGQSITGSNNPQALQNGKDPGTFSGLTPGGTEAFGYGLPHLLIDHAMINPPIRPGYWRGVNLNQNAVYVECFMDELAHELKQDPLAFRRKLLAKSPRQLAVLNAAAERGGWGKAAAPGVYRGIASIMGYGSYVAACAEVSVDGEGKVKVHRIVAATDPGHVVNPQQVRAQVEGSFVYGLSASLYGGITIKDGQVEQTNFNDFAVFHLDDMPKVETIVMPSGGFWGGVGEPTIAVATPAVLNAIFAATGKRVRELPLKTQDLKAA